MVVTIDIKNLNVSRASIFSGGSTAGGGGGKRGFGNGGGILEDMDGVITLTYKQRLIGFLLCVVAGAIIVGLAYLSFLTGITPRTIRTWVILFSVGNVIALCSTMFLMGPLNQCRRMFHPVRIIATIVYLVSIALAIYFGAFRKNIVLALLFGVIEIFALLWYSLSYIPYARTVVKKLLGL